MMFKSRQIITKRKKKNIENSIENEEEKRLHAYLIINTGKSKSAQNQKHINLSI